MKEIYDAREKYRENAAVQSEFEKMFYGEFEWKNRDTYIWIFEVENLVKLTDEKLIDLAKKKLVKLMRDPFASNLKNGLNLESCGDKSESVTIC